MSCFLKGRVCRRPGRLPLPGRSVKEQSRGLAGSRPGALLGDVTQIMQGMISGGGRALIASHCGPLRGTAMTPGDKSISHRALIIGALTMGETKITGLLEAGDVLSTANALAQFGVQITQTQTGSWQ